MPDGTTSTPFERTLVKANKVFRFLLDFNIAVANDAESPLPQDFVARKQKPDKGDNQTVKPYEARGAPKGTVGQPEKPFDAPGNTYKRAHRCAISRIQKFERQRESQIGNERKWMRRIDRKRRQNREHVQEEIVLQPL